MIDIENKGYQPTIEEINEYIGNSLFAELCSQIEADYQPQRNIEYSGDNVLLGWNVKLKKSGKTLCTLYPRKGHFYMLLVVGKKEKQAVEELLPSLSETFREVYNSTKEGMGQRWMIFDFCERTQLIDDVQKVIRIRRQSKTAGTHV